MRRPRLLMLSPLPLLLAPAAFAQDAGDHAPAERIVVLGQPFGRAQEDLAGSVAVLGGEELIHRREGTLGETLDGVPGVSADTFGGGASRPVVRGQTAPRVKVLSDGAALMDASEVSPDHAITTEPLLLDRIEILRGPAALLYGGGAIGGAVNLIDRKIPEIYPPQGASAEAELRAGTADDEEAAVLGLTLGLPGSLALRAEAATRKVDDYEAGGGWPDERVAGTFSTMTTGAVGLSWIGADGFLGLAWSGQNGAYGLPGHQHEYEDCHPHGETLHCGGHGDDDDDHEDEGHAADGDRAEAPIVDLGGTRLDVRGEWRDPFAGVERIRMRVGVTDYAHDEIDDGAVATTFTTEGYDGRVEIQHAPVGALRGVIGGQIGRTDMGAEGVETFLPQSRTDSVALFLFEEAQLGDVRLEGAARQEWQETSAQGRPDADHAPLSVSAAAIWEFAPAWSAALSLSRSQRAPGAQELYADGVHLATNTYEIGDPLLSTETANAAELTLRRTMGATTLTASAYRTDYDGYIYARTLDQFEDFRLIRYSQADAVFTGAEFEARHDFGSGIALTAFGDIVRGKLSDAGGNLPRIPAARLGARAEISRGLWFAELEYARTFEQDDIAAFETETPGYDMLNATLSYEFAAGPAAMEVFLRGTNLLDELALNHASFLTNLAPLRGRNVVLGVRAAF